MAIAYTDRDETWSGMDDAQYVVNYWFADFGPALCLDAQTQP